MSQITPIISTSFQTCIRHTIPQIIAFLSDSDGEVRKTGADVLVKLSKQGEASNLLIRRC